MKKTTISITILIMMSLLVLTGCASSTRAAQPTATPLALSGDSPTQSAVSSQEAAGFLDAFQNTLENIYTQVSPSVVTIYVVEDAPASASGFPDFPFQIPQSPQQGLGSGFVWDQQGDIVTNNHVVDGASKIEVVFSDGSTVTANVIGADPDSDLAVIRVDVPADQLHPVQMADSSGIKVGQLAIAIGNPFGQQETMTVGIISALGRSLSTEGANTQGLSYQIPDIIQTDAPINPGNSGGVLLNDQGQVIGVTSAIESPVQANIGIGFAIPSAMVEKIVPTLIQSGHYEHTWLGISGTSLTPDLAKAMDLEPDRRGALVEDIVPDSPADKANLRGSDRQITLDGRSIRIGGDVIVAIDGQPVNSMDDLIVYLSDETQVGQRVTLTLIRAGKEQSVKVTLEARPKSGTSSTLDQLPSQTP